jgi:spore germination cell wall hydrolase CwlJ-like protein
MAKPYWKFAYMVGGASLVGAYIYAAPTPVQDGVAVAASPVVMSVSRTAHQVAEKDDLTCLAQAIYYEARGESEAGQRAVGNVVLNRVADPHYPKTVCDVVFQNEQAHNRCQFSFACDGLADNPPDTRAWRRARKLAAALMTSKRRDDTGHATHYHATYVQPAWAATLEQTVDIGRHIFYRDEPRSDQATASVASVPQS